MTRDDRKERVIHARIPASLETEIKRMADRLRIPVSNLVRNILADTVAMVDGVQQNVDSAIDGLRNSLGRLESKVAATTPDHDSTEDRATDREAPTTRIEPPLTRQPKKRPGPKGRLDHVVGWQALVMRKRGMCASCTILLKPGVKAHFGVTGNPQDRIFLCPACFERVGEVDE